MDLFIDRNPAAAFQRLPAHETAGTTLLVALGSVALFLASALGWGLLAAYCWRIDRAPWSRRTWVARGLVGLLGVLLLVLLAGLNVVAGDPFGVMAGGPPFVDAVLAGLVVLWELSYWNFLPI